MLVAVEGGQVVKRFHAVRGRLVMGTLFILVIKLRIVLGVKVFRRFDGGHDGDGVAVGRLENEGFVVGEFLHALGQPPVDAKHFGLRCELLQARLDLVEKLLFAGVDGVLGFEKAAPFLCAALFQIFDTAVLFEL